MATFIDEGVNSPQEDEEQYDSLEESAEAVEPQEDTSTEEEDNEDDVPEKYKGKSVKDIIRMHQEAEKAMGKQGSEVGELRRIVDEFVKAQTVTKAPEVDEEVDFFADPDKAIARAIEKHPKVKQAEEFAVQMKKAEAMTLLKAEHPDYTDILSDPSFAEWVGKSKVRTELFSRADSKYDFDAADELLSTWKERKKVMSDAETAEKISRKNAVKAASTGSTKGSGETASKKVYRRADIIELMRTNPDRYHQLSDEIMKAYSEGRVK